jgi:hypothetical protein
LSKPDHEAIARALNEANEVNLLFLIGFNVAIEAPHD